MTFQHIELTKDQYLSDVADQLPTTAGIHLITLPTGGGKTEHKLRTTSKDGGINIFPVKAIKDQQIMNNTAIGRDCTIIQIEKLPLIDPDKQYSPIYNSIHIDEGQILYQGGFRQPVENMINFVNVVSKTRPVYLYSAAVRHELMPVNVDTVVTVSKPFNRDINIVQVPTSGEIKNCPLWVSTSIDEIIKYTDRIESGLPVMCFVNSYKQAQSVKSHLEKLGHDSIEVLDSKRTSVDAGTPNYPEQHKVYEYILKNKRLQGCGKRIVIVTDCMAEGIDILKPFINISTQAESSKLFQQQGRARVFAYHWLITGDGTDTLTIQDDQVYRNTTKDNKPHSYPLKDDSKLSEKVCNWNNDEYRRKAELYATLALHFQRGCYGVQVINELTKYGYTPVDVWEMTNVVKRRVTGIEISKNKLMKLIADHGCPLWVDRRSPLYMTLINEYEIELFDRQLTKATEWCFSWDLMKDQGFKLDCWEVYQRVNALGRAWLQWVFANGGNLSETITDVSEFKRDVNDCINAVKVDVKDAAKSARGGRIKSDMVERLSIAFWTGLMPKETEYKWWDDANKHMRDTLFKLVMGFDVDNNNEWFMPNDKPEWCLPLTNKENMAFKRREPHITKVMTVEDFCITTGHTTKSIASLKTKEVKQLTTSIKF